MNGSNFHQLEMRLRDRLIGDLIYDSDNETFSIKYTEDWQEVGFALSPKLPLDNSANSSQIRAFLVNLLPENQGLDYLIEYLSVSRANTFSLIKGIGLDTSGAVSFSLPNTAAPTTKFIKITEEDLLKRLNNPDIWPLEVWENKPRLSVAGVQSKLNLFIQNGQYGFGEGALSSTHIIKFEKNIHQHLVLNEFLTMRLAKALSVDGEIFSVANVELIKIGAHRALVVERFDRHFDESNHQVLRRHMIDSCQALGFSVNKKYERNFGDGRDVAHIREGVSLKRLFDLSALCTNPAKTKMDMLCWVIFNLLVCNYDAHGKNYSFFVSPKGLSATPWYDLVNVSLYPQFSQTLAMGIGDEFEPSEIHAYQLLEFAEECEIDKNLLKMTLEGMCKNINQQIDSVIDSFKTKDKINCQDEADYIEKYKNIIKKNCDYYLEQTQILPEINL